MDDYLRTTQHNNEMSDTKIIEASPVFAFVVLGDFGNAIKNFKMPGHSFSISNRKKPEASTSDIQIFYIEIDTIMCWKITCHSDLMDSVIGAIRGLEVSTIGFMEIIKEWTPKTITKIALNRLRNSMNGRAHAKNHKARHGIIEELVDRSNIRIKFDHASRTWILWTSTEEQLPIIKADLEALLKIPPSLIF